MRSRSLLLAAMLAMIAASVEAYSTINVVQSGQVFDKKSLSVSKGDRIVFENQDDVTHNISVYPEDGDAVDLGLQKPGVNLTYKFDKSGRFAIRCSIHPSMKMTVSVR